jgi:two-component system chemotaxis response regulator CheV
VDNTQSTQGQAIRQGEANILLESGTNELEVLVFELAGQRYGVNVAKVREVILPVRVAASPQQPPCVMGMFNLRGGVLPLIDLHKYLNVPLTERTDTHHRVIVTEFNGQRAAFRVDGVEQIYRMSWTSMRPVPDTDFSIPEAGGSDGSLATLSGGGGGGESGGGGGFAITGITEINNELILMLDFESIFDHISMQDQLHVTQVDNTLGVQREQHLVFVADDSKFIRDIMHRVLLGSGYLSVKAHINGLELWNSLQLCVRDGKPLPDVIVTDIEMPQMDGLALTKRIKDDPNLRHIPVLLFSSLITQDTHHKGEQVGADDQIAKPQLPHMVQIIDRWIEKIETKAA